MSVPSGGMYPLWANACNKMICASLLRILDKPKSHTLAKGISPAQASTTHLLTAAYFHCNLCIKL